MKKRSASTTPARHEKHSERDIDAYNGCYFFVANPLERYNLSSRNQLKTNEDGSVDLFIQHESPGQDRESNWLPAPKEWFVLMLRLYWPRETPPSILDGSWRVPPVMQAHEH